MYYLVNAQFEVTLEEMLDIIDDAQAFGFSFIIQDGLLYAKED